MAEDNTNGAGTEPDVTAAAISDGAYTLFVADFNDTDTAWAAFQELKALEDGTTVEIDGVVVVKREADGTLKVQKATDHSTRSGLTWGVVGGVVLGLIFPPSIIGSAAVLGAGTAPPAATPGATTTRKSLNSSRLSSPRAFRDPRARLRPGRREDPPGAESGQRDRRIRGRRGGRARHQGRRDGYRPVVELRTRLSGK